MVTMPVEAMLFTERSILIAICLEDQAYGIADVESALRLSGGGGGGFFDLEGGGGGGAIFRVPLAVTESERG